MRGRSRRSLGWGSLFQFPAPLVVTGLTLSVSWNGSNYVASSSWVLPVDSNPVLDGVYVEWSINGGAFVADAAYPATQTTATKTISGGQTVRVQVRTRNVASVYSSYVTSSTTGSAPDAVTGFTATNSATPGTVSLAWSNPTSTTGVTLTPSTGASIPALGVVTSYSHVAGQSVDVSYTITANNAYGSSQSRSSSVRTLLAPPTSVSITATNPGDITMQITDPDERPYVSYYTAALETNGVWSSDLNNGMTKSYTFTEAAHGTSYRVRSSAVDVFGQASAYATSGSAVGINDTTAPTVPTPALSWNQGVAGFSISWGALTDVSTISSASLQVLYVNGSWTKVIDIGTGASSTTHACPSDKRGQSVSYRIVATDVHGNVATGTTATIVAKPLGEILVFATQTATWTGRYEAWRTDTSLVVSGYFDATWGQQTGYFLYNNGIANACKGYTPDNGKIVIQRSGSNGFSGINKMAPSNVLSTNDGATYSVGNIVDGPSLVGAGVSGEFFFPSTFLATMGSGFCRSIATVNSAGVDSTLQSGYRVLVSVYSNALCGLLYLYFD